MLGAQVESHHDGPFYELCKASRDLYHEWTEELERISGCSVEYIARGILRVALTETDEAELRSRLPWLGPDVRWNTRAELLALEPALSNEVRGGIFFANDHQVQAPKLAKALHAALLRLGVRIIEHTEVESWLFTDNRQVRGVQTLDQTITCEQLVVAAGAWSPALLEPFGIRLPVQPVKGQCYAVRPPSPIIQHTVFTKGCYIVPKLDGSFIIGATEEQSGFDKSINPNAVDIIQQTAMQLLPQLAQASFERTWTGLRPGSADGMPFLGKAPHWNNVFIAAGHYRNGILLTPITARIMSYLLTKKPSPIDLQPFAIDRLSPEPNHPY
jgi:glycine oxidase